MIKVYSTDFIRKLEKYSFGEYAKSGLPSYIAMENAGREAARVILDLLDDEHKKVLVLCGSGGNGGDGYVVSRVLASHGYKVDCLSLKTAKGDAKVAKSLAKYEDINFYTPENFKTSKKYDIAIDALLGTGYNGTSLSDLFSSYIKYINSHKNKFVVSLDIPSGVNSQTGEASNVCVEADLTLSFGTLKPGHYLLPGSALCGEVENLSIGLLKNKYIKKTNSKPEFEIFHEEDACHVYNKYLIRPSHVTTHKGKKGHVGVIAGIMPGAAALSAYSALAIGAGLVTISKYFNDTEYPELMYQNQPSIKKFIDGKRVVVIGPGLGTNDDAKDLLLETLKVCKKNKTPLVIDADAINILAKEKSLTKLLGQHCILTPHVGEFSRLSGIEKDNIELTCSTLEISHSLRSAVLLKSIDSCLCTPKATPRVFIGRSASLATAGSGDTLTGMIAGLISGSNISSQKELYEITSLAVYSHSLAGKVLQAEGEFGHTAKSIIEMASAVLNSFE